MKYTNDQLEDMMTGLPFTITWDSQGFYRVSIPNYEGGEVVTVEDANAAIAAAVQAERDITDRYRADWRSVCNALNTSPDSAASVVLAKIKTLQDAAAIRARHGRK